MSHKREKKRISQERGKNKIEFFFAKESEVRRAFMADQPMILLVFKESYLNTDETNQYLPSMAVSLLQEFNDVFLKEIPIGYRALEALTPN